MEVPLKSTTQQRPGTPSHFSLIHKLTPENRKNWLQGLTDDEALANLYDWRFWARAKQIAPINPGWFIWLLLAGRGFGKTRTGAEYIRARVEDGYTGRIHFIGPTTSDVRHVMVEGPSGILEISPPDNRPVYEPSNRRLIWPNGAKGALFSAEEPKRLRGPQCGLLWADEVASWRFDDAWNLAMFGLRIRSVSKGGGFEEPKAVVTTTPRPTDLIKKLLVTDGCVYTKGTTYENRDNLAPSFYNTIIKQYEGTRLGRQELLAEILVDTPGALWNLETIDDSRISYKEFEDIELVRIAVAIDPAVSSKKTSNETGIVAAGVDANGEGYILADRSGIYTPLEWAREAIKLFANLKADRIIAEKNQGGALVEANLRTVSPNIPYVGVHASRGKRARAEPVSALYEQGRVHHVGSFGKLEDQLTVWDASDGSDSPDRLDALVWVLTYLMLWRKLKKATSRPGSRRR
jgi:phage terminase large subunit-like protein